GGHRRQRLPRPWPLSSGRGRPQRHRARAGSVAPPGGVVRAGGVKRGCGMVFRAIYEKIKQGLAKTRDLFTGVAALFRLKGRVDRDFLKELEKRLYLADVASHATS